MTKKLLLRSLLRPRDQVISLRKTLKHRNQLFSMANPWPDLAVLANSEQALRARVQGFSETVAVVSTLLCGITGSIVFAAAREVKAEGTSNQLSILHQKVKIFTFELGVTLDNLLHGALMSGFVLNVQALLSSSLVLASLNSTPNGWLRQFVIRNSILISSLGWSLVPGTLFLNTSALIAIHVLLPGDIGNITLAACGLSSSFISVIALRLLRDNYLVRTQILNRLLKSKRL